MERSFEAVTQAQAAASGQTVWCLGMYASASTWLFNVAQQVLQGAQREEIHTVFVSGKEKALSLAEPGRATIIKSHEIGSDAMIVEVARASVKILLSIRDPRDAVTSLMQAHKYEFDRALYLVEQSARLCAGFAKDRRTKLFRYETGFFEDSGTVRAIGLHLGHELAGQAAQAIYGSLTRAEVERHIGQMPKMAGILRNAASGDLLDAKTQWHSHHAGRKGAIGKWKGVLTPAQTGEVERRLGFYFAVF